MPFGEVDSRGACKVDWCCFSQGIWRKVAGRDTEEDAQGP